MNRQRRIFVSAAETSGDALATDLVQELNKRRTTQVFAMGGPELAATGATMLRSADELNVMGLVEVARRLPQLVALNADLALKVRALKPDVAILVDAPDFNIRLARRLQGSGIPVVMYVGPSVWAWRPGRAKRYAPLIDKLLVLFPFEQPIWREAGVNVNCVGHPLVDAIEQPARLEQVDPQLIALLPGSRPSEIERHWPLLLQTAARLPGFRFVCPVAPMLNQSAMATHSERHGVKIEFVQGQSTLRYEAIARSRLCLVASGTATLETALLGRPQVVFYRSHPLSYALARPLLRVRHFSLPNLLLNESEIVELLQGEANVDGLARAVRQLLDQADGLELAMNRAVRLRQVLPPAGVAVRAANAVEELLGA